MGSFDINCAASGMMIADGNATVSFPVRAIKSIDEVSTDIPGYCIAGLPFTGRYDDYGRIVRDRPASTGERLIYEWLNPGKVMDEDNLTDTLHVGGGPLMTMDARVYQYLYDTYWDKMYRSFCRDANISVEVTEALGDEGGEYKRSMMVHHIAMAALHAFGTDLDRPKPGDYAESYIHATVYGTMMKHAAWVCGFQIMPSYRTTQMTDAINRANFHMAMIEILREQVEWRSALIEPLSEQVSSVYG